MINTGCLSLFTQEINREQEITSTVAEQVSNEIITKHKRNQRQTLKSWASVLKLSKSLSILAIVSNSLLSQVCLHILVFFTRLHGPLQPSFVKNKMRTAFLLLRQQLHQAMARLYSSCSLWSYYHCTLIVTPSQWHCVSDMSTIKFNTKSMIFRIVPHTYCTINTTEYCNNMINILLPVAMCISSA